MKTKKIIIWILLIVNLGATILTKPVEGGNAPGYLVSLIAMVVLILVYYFWPERKKE